MYYHKDQYIVSLEIEDDSRVNVFSKIQKSHGYDKQSNRNTFAK